jgi:hypothetical protein
MEADGQNSRKRIYSGPSEHDVDIDVVNLIKIPCRSLRSFATDQPVSNRQARRRRLARRRIEGTLIFFLMTEVY